MSPHFGFIHDYDLRANDEPSARGVTCAVCDTSPVLFQWSDYSGEAMCHECGCPYQLKWGSDEQRTESKYPYLSFMVEFVPIAREYWQAKKAFVTYGTMLTGHQWIAALNAWLRQHHPEWLEPKPEKAMIEKENPCPA